MSEHVTWFSPQPEARELPSGIGDPFAEGPPHPLARAAAEMVMASLRSGSIAPDVPTSLLYGIDGGKMFGVLVVRDASGRLGFLRAFSGQRPQIWDVEGFAPPTFDRAARETVEPRGERVVRGFTARVVALKQSERWAELRAEIQRIAERHEREDEALRTRMQARRAARQSLRAESGAVIAEIDFGAREDETEHRREKARMKLERAPLERASASFQQRLRRIEKLRLAASRIVSRQLYDCYVFSNRKRETRTVWQLCAPAAPPSGTGDCAAPKLLVFALRNGLEPLALAEFWWGKSPRSAAKVEGHFYPACAEKCGAILPFLLAR